MKDHCVGGLCYFRQQDGRWRIQDPLKRQHVFTRLNIVTMVYGNGPVVGQIAINMEEIAETL